MRNAAPLVLIFIAALPSAAGADVSAAAKHAKSGEFEAAGEVRCAQEVGQSLGTCGAKVARASGSAAVVVTFPNGFSRTLTFSDGKFLRGNATMSGVGTDTDWRLDGGFFNVRVDDQRFELPETLVFGE
ncbi:MAG: hypothetical protein AAF543_00040 [Pseudomonadota bacterium]